MADGYIEDKMNAHGRGAFRAFKPPKWWVDKQPKSTGVLFRKAGIRDLTPVMAILDAARQRMFAEGKCQWTESYPREVHVVADIAAGHGYVLVEDGRVVAYGAVIVNGEPAYEDLEGEWLTDGDYVVVHRLAVAADAQGRGVGRRFMAAVEEMAAAEGVGSFRVDTNFDNERMLALLDRCGFTFTGLIQYPQGERRAFEKLI